MELIYLVGYMGSGKSSVGRKLASELNWNFVDLDEYIEDRCGHSISKLFSHFGETIFRQLEASNVYASALWKNTVVATGGGAPCFFENMDVMNDAGLTIYLDVPVQQIINRIQKDHIERPLVSGKSNEEMHQFVNEHLASRIAHYQQAQLRINAEGSIEEVVRAVMNEIEKIEGDTMK